MKNLIKYTKLGGIFLGAIMLSALIFGLLNLIGVSYKVTSILNIVIMILFFFVFGIIEGMNTSKKGFIAGLKIGLIYLIIMIVINLTLFQSPFNFSRIIYYLILLVSSMFGAMVGINRKKKE